MNVSVYIPSIPQDFKNTPAIAQAYLDGPLKPNEIVVCLSGADQVDQASKDHLRSIPSVILQEHKEWLLPGPNRNLARQYCSGDVIAYQDADDLPHARRLQICMGYFERPETSDIMVLNHGYFPTRHMKVAGGSLFAPKVFNAATLYAAYFPHNVYTECVGISKTYGKWHRGNRAFTCTGANLIRKEVLDHVQWRHPDNIQLKVTDNPHYGAERRYAEDYEFCMECLFKLKRSLLITSPLYYVRCF